MKSKRTKKRQVEPERPLYIDAFRDAEMRHPAGCFFHAKQKPSALEVELDELIHKENALAYLMWSIDTTKDPLSSPNYIPINKRPVVTAHDRMVAETLNIDPCELWVIENNFEPPSKRLCLRRSCKFCMFC